MPDGNVGELEESGEAEGGQALSLRRIRRILSDSRDVAERQDAARQLLPHLWDRIPWRRYHAGCILTTRVYLPGSLFLLEWGSFPNRLTRELRRNKYGSLPPTPEAQHAALKDTLSTMLTGWIDRDIHRLTHYPRPQSESTINMDIAADVCEAIGRMGIADAEASLLQVIRHFTNQGNQVRTAAMLALAALPPEHLTLTWRMLRFGDFRERRMIAGALTYMRLPGAVPFLLDALPGIAQESALNETVGIPLLNTLGYIGDPRALPDLSALARADHHPLQPTARLAIRRIMKEAAGQEEVTLVRASGASSLNEDVLLRPSSENAASSRPEQLLRASTHETRTDDGRIQASKSSESKAQENRESRSGHIGLCPEPRAEEETEGAG